MDCGAPEAASRLHLFACIDMGEVRTHYMRRRRVASCLSGLPDAPSDRKYVRLALGIDDEAGNDSATEHELDPQILAETS